MRQRVQREPAGVSRGRITQAIGHQAVRELVGGDGQQERGNLEDEIGQEPGGILEEARHREGLRPAPSRR